MASRLACTVVDQVYSLECLQILLYCGCPNVIPLEGLLQTPLQHRVSPSQEVGAEGGSRVYQDQRAGLGGGGKPAFQLGKTLDSLPSWALSALEANLFPSDRWATRQQQAWDSFREGRGGRLPEQMHLCVGYTFQPPQHCLLLAGAVRSLCVQLLISVNFYTVRIIFWVLSVSSFGNEHQMNQSNLG